MKYSQLALLCLICVSNSYGQIGTRSYHTAIVKITKEKKPKRIFTKVEITPSTFSVGDSLVRAIEADLSRALSIKNKAKAGKYIASIKFLVERDGSVADIQCLNDPGFGMCVKVVEVMRRRLRGNWRPSADPNVKEYHNTY
jgi:hypothetical protein